MPQYLMGVTFPVLSRYEITLKRESIIGKGGMGVVFRAHDRLLNKEVAIKTISPTLVDQDKLSGSIEAQLFFREAMTHARIGLAHPTLIMPVHNYGIEDDTPFMEMEYLKHGSLLDKMNEAKRNRRRGPLFDEHTIKEYISAICSGLTILHGFKVYHSDLKPANLLFPETGNALIIADLGLARIAQSGLLTKAGLQTFFGGTVNYTPQEVSEGAKKATERTDLYSVGVILYEMITGEILLWSQARTEHFDKHATLTRPAKDLIIRACQFMGRNNFASAEELKDKLNSVALL